MTALLIILGVAGLLFLAHLGLTAAEQRGWIFYRHRPRVQFLGLLEEIVQPSVEYLVEEQSSTAIRADHSETGEPVPDQDDG